MAIVAATDGSALGNPGPAGWAWYIDDQRWAAGGWPHGTNNMGELTAVLELLRATADADTPLEILCDSQYVINTITKWMRGWKAKGWKKKDGKPPENLQIIKDLDEAMAGRTVRFQWVKGHAGHELNEAADVRANAAAVAYQAGRTPDAGPGFRPGPDAGPEARASQDGGLFFNPTSADGTARRPTAPSTPDLFSSLFGGDDEPTPQARVESLQRELLQSPADPRIAELLHPAWSQVGPSAQLRTRDDVLLDGNLPGGEGLELLESRPLGRDHMLVLWRGVAEGRAAVWSAVWSFEQGDWRQVFAQATPEPEIGR